MQSVNLDVRLCTVWRISIDCIRTEFWITAQCRNKKIAFVRANQDSQFLVDWVGQTNWIVLNCINYCAVSFVNDEYVQVWAVCQFSEFDFELHVTWRSCKVVLVMLLVIFQTNIWIKYLEQKSLCLILLCMKIFVFGKACLSCTWHC